MIGSNSGISQVLSSLQNDTETADLIREEKSLLLNLEKARLVDYLGCLKDRITHRDRIRQQPSLARLLQNGTTALPVFFDFVTIPPLADMIKEWLSDGQGLCFVD